MSWRDTLFIWRGSARCTKGAFEWKGSWVGVDSSAAKNVKVPPKARFSESNMLFCVNGEHDVKQEGTKKGSCQEDGVELTFKVTKGKGWLLDDMLYHKDHAQDIYFRTSEAKTVLVGATGSNDFGSFLSLGICDGVASIEEIKAGKEFTLTLGRRYLEEADIRSSWKANAEIRECLKNFSFPKTSLHHSAIFQLPTLDAAPVLKTLENAKKRKGAKDIAEQQTAKKIKVENHHKETTDTVKLAWGTYNTETSTFDEHSVSIAEIDSVSAALQGAEAGENNEHSLSLSLTRDGKALAKIDLNWWDDREGATLMHFHQLRQDLADFCMELWTEAGRSTRDYNDMAVEFGESRYSGLEVGCLIEDALDCDLASEILYVVNAKGSDKEALSRLYQHMVRLFPEAHIISHKADDPPATGWSKVGRGWRVHGVPCM